MATLRLIGFGVFAIKEFRKTDFLLQYPGKVMSAKKGKQLEDSYPLHLGSYLFYHGKIW